MTAIPRTPADLPAGTHVPRIAPLAPVAADEPSADEPTGATRHDATPGLDHATCAAPGGEYAYTVGDYAREALQVLGEGWGAESGYIWGPGGQSVLLFVCPAPPFGGLTLSVEKGLAEPELHSVDLPEGASSDPAGLRVVAEHIAKAIGRAHRS